MGVIYDTVSCKNIIANRIRYDKNHVASCHEDKSFFVALITQTEESIVLIKAKFRKHFAKTQYCGVVTIGFMRNVVLIITLSSQGEPTVVIIILCLRSYVVV